MPVGTGIHPYFIRMPGSAVAINSTTVWSNDESGLAIELAHDGRFYDGAMVPVARLEGCDNFFPSIGDALIATPDGVVRLQGSDTAGFHIYAPAEENFFCVEPVSHAPNAFGRGEYDAHDLLLAGEKRIWSYRISL